MKKCFFSLGVAGLVWVISPGAEASSLEVTNSASGVGNYGLEVTMEPDPSTLAYVQQSFPVTNAVRVRFQWRPGTMPRWGEGNPTTHADDPLIGLIYLGGSGFSLASSNRMAGVFLTVRNDEWVLLGQCRTDSNVQFNTAYVSLANSVTDTNTFLQLELEIRPSNGTANGLCCLHIEGIGDYCRSDLDNDQVSYSVLSSGLTYTRNIVASSALSGTFHVDEFVVSN